MSASADPYNLSHAFADMRAFWVTAEIDAHYRLSSIQARQAPMSAKGRDRAGILISRELARAAERRIELTKWLEIGFGPADTIRDILPRIERTDAVWRQTLSALRAVPLGADPLPPKKAIQHPTDLPGWLQQLNEWAQPESEIIEDLDDAVAHGDARSDEALDHVQWSAEDDIEAIDTVLQRARTWPLNQNTQAHLQEKSAEARAQLMKLIALVERARPFSESVQISAALARLAQEQGQKPH